MFERKKINDLTKVATIRALEKLSAQSEMTTANLSETNCLNKREQEADGFKASIYNWNKYIDEQVLLPEYLKYLSDDLVTSEVSYKEAVSTHIAAKQISAKAYAKWRMCDARVVQAATLRKKVQRKLVQLDEEKILANVEERVTFDWSRKCQ